MKNCPDSQNCPKCKSGWAVTSFSVLRFHGDQIGEVLLILTSMVAISTALGLGFGIAIIGAFLAAIPYFASLSKKHICSSCELEFSTENMPRPKIKHPKVRS